MSRVITAARIQLINQQTFIWVPLIVLAGAYAVCLALFWLIPADGIDAGGAQAPLWYFGVIGAQALTLTFPFSQAMSITRREFVLGTLLAASGTALMLSVLFVVGGVFEKWTGGYGGDHSFFRVPGLWSDGWAAAGVIHFVAAMAAFLVGFGFATVYMRFNAMVLTLTLTALGLALVAVGWILTEAGAWGSIGDWMADHGAIGVATIWGIPLVAVLGVASYGMLRRATI